MIILIKSDRLERKLARATKLMINVCVFDLSEICLEEC